MKAMNKPVNRNAMSYVKSEEKRDAKHSSEFTTV